MKDQIIKKVMSHLSDDLEVSQLQKVRLVLTYELKNYCIEESKNELIIYDESSDLAAYKAYFVSMRLSGLSPGSIRLYMRTIDQFMRYVRVSFSDVKTDDIRLFLANRELMNKVSKATLARERGCICRFFKWLAEEEYIKKDISLRVERVKIPKRLKKAFTAYEIEKVRQATVSAKDKVIVELLFSTGCRVSELCDLKLENYNQQHGSITVVGKGNRERVVYVNARAKLAIENYLCLVPRETGPIIVGRSGGRHAVSGIQKIIKNIGKRADVYAHPHKFRRTAATLAFKHGMELGQVRQFLGHSNLDTTLQYIDTSGEDLKVIHEKFLG